MYSWKLVRPLLKSGSIFLSVIYPILPAFTNDLAPTNVYYLVQNYQKKRYLPSLSRLMTIAGVNGI